jgi:tetratricopeptide (TPR) repeat protein
VGKCEEAIADCTEVIRLNPSFARAYKNRGLAYRLIGEQIKAEADFAKAKELGYEPECSLV